MPTPSVPIVVLDVLQSIHEAEQASVFRLMGDAAPPVAPVPPRVQEVLRGLYEANVRHVNELAAEIRRLGDSPRARRPAELTSDESYLRFLSLQFLVPKLVREKQLMVERYENALRALPKELPAGIPDMLRRQLAEQVANVDALQAAVEKVA